VRIGAFDVRVVSDGQFRLDGGAMFGTVPKVLWQKRTPADDRNRIQLGLNALLIETPHATVLVDSGIGDKLSPKAQDIFAVDHTLRLERSLAGLGVKADDVNIVIATHLHLDHAGGLTKYVDSRVVPTFKSARHVIRTGEWQDATHPHDRNRASYLSDDFVPLAEAGLVDLIAHDGEIVPGVSVWRTGGHTAHHQIVRIESEGQIALFLADLVPTTAHLDPAWVMGYDLYPVEAMQAKGRWLREAVEGEYVIFFEHDPAVAAGVIRLESGRMRVDPVEP
jgi:glyoxylase-like metal-dependent hydrolase (beta-lactamase superfamily II)